MYWIYTDYKVNELKACETSDNSGAIPIARLAKMHEGLPHVSTLSIRGFQLVYSGIAGPALGLRGRIHQHFNGGQGTGCLSILKSTLCDLDRWRLSFVAFGALAGDEHDVQVDYSTQAKDLERMWRLTYGWPLLCRT
jgi:hypothetical protein